ncbi:sensor histidine kinase [Jannaschia sp. R86511]|uniref:sensor histidine kinase n=1 Tax=Jannaschia sp. R86511 TaxID=3093853 RepID=UPI0036D3E673
MRRAAQRSGSPAAVDDLATPTVRVALLVRQIALAAAALVTLVTGTSWTGLAVVIALLLTSQLGLHSTRVLRLVERHPALALVDVLLVSTAMVLLGPRHPAVLAALTSALIIGVLFRWWVSPLLVVALLAGHALSLPGVADLTLNDMVGTPVVIMSMAAIGAGFRHVAQQARRKDEQAAADRQAAATAEERLRLARDVHDTVAKSVQGVALLAASLPQWVERDQRRAVTHAGLVATSAREAVTEARALLTGLRAAGDDTRFEGWLSERLAEWGAGRGPAVTAEIAAVAPLSARACRELRAATCEVLENVDRHAADAAVDVSLRQVGDLVVLVVRDHGPGFHADREREAVRQGRYGLLGLRERLESVGGRVDLVSAPGTGTTVTLSAPAAVAADHDREAPVLRIVS